VNEIRVMNLGKSDLKVCKPNQWF